MSVPEDEPDYLQQQATRCRNLAKSSLDERMRTMLLSMAKEYEERADAIAIARMQKPGDSKARPG